VTWARSPIFVPILVGILVTALCLAVRWGSLRLLKRRAAGMTLLQVVRIPSVLWCLVIGGYGGLEVAELPTRAMGRLELWMQAFVIASITVTVANLCGLLVEGYARRFAPMAGVTGLGQTATRLSVLTIGGLVVVSSLGVSITPLLTALGVGGLAVALALQDSLANFFAGAHLLADQPVRVGDYIKLDSGAEGYVLDIGWRSTRIRMLANNVVIVPNQTLARAIITNYDLPEPRMSLLIPLSVSYDVDPGHLERVVREEAATAAGEVPGLLADPPAFVRFIPGFGAHSLDFTLICQVATFVDQYLVQHELRKRLLSRFRAEGIEIPYPVRTVLLKPAADGAAVRSAPEGPVSGPR
jgi:small-conductance mechanosensitive channel